MHVKVPAWSKKNFKSSQITEKCHFDEPNVNATDMSYYDHVSAAWPPSVDHAVKERPGLDKHDDSRLISTYFHCFINL